MNLTNNLVTGTGVGDCLQNKDILQDCKKNFKNETTEKLGMAIAACKYRDGLVHMRNSKAALLVKTEGTGHFYRSLDFYFALETASATEAVQKNVEEQIKKNDDLAKLLTELSKSIKVLKDKASELKAKACNLEIQIKDECNTEQLRILDCNFQEKCQYPNPNDSEGKPIGAFKAVILVLIAKTEVINRQASKTFNASAEIAGIQTFSNVKSLKDMTKALTDAAKAFKADVDTNVKDRMGEATKAQDELAKIIKELTVRKTEQNKASAIYEGIAFTSDFLCDSESCTGKSIDDVSGVCKDVICLYCNCGENLPPEPTPKPGYTAINQD